MSENVEIPLQGVEILADENYLRLGEFFNLDDHASRLEKKESLKEILDWARSHAEGNEPIDYLLYLRGLERTIRGDSNEDRISKLRRYIFLEKEQERLNKEKALLTGGEWPEPAPAVE